MEHNNKTAEHLTAEILSRAMKSTDPTQTLQSIVMQLVDAISILQANESIDGTTDD